MYEHKVMILAAYSTKCLVEIRMSFNKIVHACDGQQCLFNTKPDRITGQQYSIGGFKDVFEASTAHLIFVIMVTGNGQLGNDRIE